MVSRNYASYCVDELGFATAGRSVEEKTARWRFSVAQKMLGRENIVDAAEDVLFEVLIACKRVERDLRLNEIFVSRRR